MAYITSPQCMHILSALLDSFYSYLAGREFCAKDHVSYPQLLIDAYKLCPGLCTHLITSRDTQGLSEIKVYKACMRRMK